jgi:hypothetical protein
VENPERKKLLVRPRLRWKDTIRMDHNYTGWDDVEWVQLAQVRGQWRAVVNVVINRWVMAPRS